ncbi:MAG TPA: prepilin peptidase [Leptospiraceae bacterium]|nr:prepilin peptidase [Leptospiraceae bacterium]
MDSVWVLLYFSVFFAGASLASFYHTAAERVLLLFYGKERKQGSRTDRLKRLFTVPSHCFYCGSRIPFLNLIPFAGFLFSRGRCVSCGAEIPKYFFFLEAGFGILGILSLYFTENIYFTLLFLFLSGHILVFSLTDLKKRILDFEHLPFVLIFGLLGNYYWELRTPDLTELYVFLGFLGAYFLIYFIYPKGMGLGDVFFAPCLAVIAGHPWWMFFLNSSYALALAYAFVMRKDKSLKKNGLPMGFFFGLGLLLTYIAKLFSRLFLE